MRRVAVLALVLLVLGRPANAAAQSANDRHETASALQGRTVELSGFFFAEAWDFNGRPGAALAGGTASVGLPIHGRWSAVIEGLALNVDERRRDTIVGGVSIMVRRRMAQRGATTVFVEAGAGVSYASQVVPAEGTRFNYPLQAGVGVARRFGPRTGWLASVRLFHLSNNGLNGPSHNPDIEALGARLGLVLNF